MTQAILGRVQLDCKFGWLFSRQYDLLFFVFPCVFAVGMLLLSKSGLMMATACLFFGTELVPMIGTMHGAASWFHYWDTRNREHYFGTPKRRLIFLFMPIVILLLTTLGYVWHLPEIVFAVYMVWTVQHLTQQNVGILLLYHNAGEAVVPRRLEARTLQLPAILFGLLYIVHIKCDGPMFVPLAESCIFLCLLLCGNYLFHLYQQAKRGGHINLSALCFWFIATWFFLPLALIKQQFFAALMVPLFVHYCQYLGLNYILVARKYETENRNSTVVKRPMIAFIGIVAAITAFMTGAFYLSAVSSYVLYLYGLIMAFSLVHYFQDAFIWRFRDQFQRQSILPYLKPKPR